MQLEEHKARPFPKNTLKADNLFWFQNCLTIYTIYNGKVYARQKSNVFQHCRCQIHEMHVHPPPTVNFLSGWHVTSGSQGFRSTSSRGQERRAWVRGWIKSRILKDCLPVILGPLTNINCSLTSCIFPTAWKEVEVIPIVKDGDHEVASNNRLISLLGL